MEIAGFQPVDVVALAIGDRETQHHHVYLDPEGRPLFLGPKRSRTRHHSRRENRYRSRHEYFTIDLQDCPPK